MLGCKNLLCYFDSKNPDQVYFRFHMTFGKTVLSFCENVAVNLYPVRVVARASE